MRTLALRLRSLFRRGRMEQELSAELQFHLEHKIEEGVARDCRPSKLAATPCWRWVAWSKSKKNAVIAVA